MNTNRNGSETLGYADWEPVADGLRQDATGPVG